MNATGTFWSCKITFNMLEITVFLSLNVYRFLIRSASAGHPCYPISGGRLHRWQHVWLCIWMASTYWKLGIFDWRFIRDHAWTTLMGITGWRIAFHVVALITVIVGILVRLYAEGPHFLNVGKGKQLPNKPVWTEMKDLVIEAKAVIKIPSFQIFVAQGIMGSLPWSSQ